MQYEEAPNLCTRSAIVISRCHVIEDNDTSGHTLGKIFKILLVVFRGVRCHVRMIMWMDEYMRFSQAQLEPQTTVGHGLLQVHISGQTESTWLCAVVRG